jgi:hypothetical protein
MIQNGDRQAAVFDPGESFLKRTDPCDPCSLVFQSERHIECNERLVLGDEDKAAC